jgi:hypothetical protein
MADINFTSNLRSLFIWEDSEQAGVTILIMTWGGGELSLHVEELREFLEYVAEHHAPAAARLLPNSFRSESLVE